MCFYRLCLNRQHFDICITISVERVFIYFYVLEESEVVAQKSSIRKVFLKIPQVHRKTFALGSLLKKSCRLEACNFFKYRIW